MFDLALTRAMTIQLVDELRGDLDATVGKFILVEHEERYFMVRSSPRICEYHAQILARFAQTLGMTVQLTSDGSDLAAHHEKLRLHGGGYWELQRDGRIRLFAKSAAFGVFDRSLIEGLGIASAHHWLIDLD